jgi:cell division protein FtsI (penicillin-binding protein 3)
MKLVSLPSNEPGAPIAVSTEDESTMPDFRGMTLREALKKSREKGIELKVQGSGWAASQEPAPGVSLLTHRSCSVSFASGR